MGINLLPLHCITRIEGGHKSPLLFHIPEQMSLKSTLEEIVSKHLPDESYYLVDVQLVEKGPKSQLTILIDADHGVSIEACAKVSRQVAEEIEAKELLSEAYILEVSSPGLDFPLSSKRQYTKNEILAMYCNVYDFGNYSVGVSSAAQTYFSKEPKDLTIDESAMLVGMFKNSGLYNPVRNPEGVKNRRNVVLLQMQKADIISENEKVRLQSLPIKLNFKLETHKDGTATYFREYLRDYMKKWVEDNKKPDGSDYDIYKDGLKIYTTIDSRMQLHAEEAVSEHMKNMQEQFFIEMKTNKNAPFVNISEAETKKLLLKAMKSSERWRLMNEEGKSEDEILK